MREHACVGEWHVCVRVHVREHVYACREGEGGGGGGRGRERRRSDQQPAVETTRWL